MMFDMNFKTSLGHNCLFVEMNIYYFLKRRIFTCVAETAVAETMFDKEMIT